VIQAVALAPADGLTVPNAYGQLPFAGADPTRPNEAYFQQVDFVVNKAEELGMFIGMLPTWGSYWPAANQNSTRPQRGNTDNSSESATKTKPSSGSSAATARFKLMRNERLSTLWPKV
jgi:hypothetical protein